MAAWLGWAVFWDLNSGRLQGSLVFLSIVSAGADLSKMLCSHTCGMATTGEAGQISLPPPPQGLFPRLAGASSQHGGLRAAVLPTRSLEQRLEGTL